MMSSMPMSFQGLSDQFGSLFLLEDDCSKIGPSAQLCVAHACPDTKIDRYRRLQKEPHIQRTTRPFQKIGEKAAHYFFHRSHVDLSKNALTVKNDSRAAIS